jgi:hypothetical protein
MRRRRRRRRGAVAVEIVVDILCGRSEGSDE